MFPFCCPRAGWHQGGVGQNLEVSIGQSTVSSQPAISVSTALACAPALALIASSSSRMCAALPTLAW